MQSWLLAVVAAALLGGAARAEPLRDLFAARPKDPLSPAGRAWKGAVGVGKRLYGGAVACCIQEGMTPEQVRRLIGPSDGWSCAVLMTIHHYRDYGIHVWYMWGNRTLPDGASVSGDRVDSVGWEPPW
jgi:hypothetical protein